MAETCGPCDNHDEGYKPSGRPVRLSVRADQIVWNPGEGGLFASGDIIRLTDDGSFGAVVTFNDVEVGMVRPLIGGEESYWSAYNPAGDLIYRGDRMSGAHALVRHQKGRFGTLAEREAAEAVADAYFAERERRGVAGLLVTEDDEDALHAEFYPVDAEAVDA